jgi:hypothetical protein
MNENRTRARRRAVWPALMASLVFACTFDFDRFDKPALPGAGGQASGGSVGERGGANTAGSTATGGAATAGGSGGTSGGESAGKSGGGAAGAVLAGAGGDDAEGGSAMSAGGSAMSAGGSAMSAGGTANAGSSGAGRPPTSGGTGASGGNAGSGNTAGHLTTTGGVNSGGASVGGSNSGGAAGSTSSAGAGGKGFDCTTVSGNVWNQHCYFSVSEGTGVYWSAAQSACSSFGAHLVTITSEDEQRAIAADFFPAVKDYWIGLSLADHTANSAPSSCKSNAASCPFSWISGEPLSYVNWAVRGTTSEPDFSGPCVRIQLGDQTWGDLACSSTQLPAICEHD